MYRIPDLKDIKNTFFFQEVQRQYDSVVKEEKKALDSRPLVEIITDYDYRVETKGDFELQILTSVGKVCVDKFEFLNIFAKQLICEVPSLEAAPDLPSRRTPVTGQLKLYIDVFSMLRYVKSTDRVLVVGSNGANQKGGNAYLLLASRVKEVHLYDPAEESTCEKLIKGTLFKYYKQEFRGQVKNYDIYFNDAYHNGQEVFLPYEGVRVFSLKCLGDPHEFKKKHNIFQKLYIYGQLHTDERRLSNVPRTYVTYNSVGTCPACIEIGYFGGNLGEYDKSILYRCHQTLSCTNNRGITSRKAGKYVDKFVGVVVSQRPYYYVAHDQRGSYSTIDPSRAISQFVVNNVVYERVVQKRECEEVEMGALARMTQGPVVLEDARMLYGLDLFFGERYFVIMGDVYVTDFVPRLSPTAREFKPGQIVIQKRDSIDVLAIPQFESIVVQRFGIKKMVPQRFSRDQLVEFLQRKYGSYYKSV